MIFQQHSAAVAQFLQDVEVLAEATVHASLSSYYYYAVAGAAAAVVVPAATVLIQDADASGLSFYFCSAVAASVAVVEVEAETVSASNRQKGLPFFSAIPFCLYFFFSLIHSLILFRCVRIVLVFILPDFTASFPIRKRLLRSSLLFLLFLPHTPFVYFINSSLFYS